MTNAALVGGISACQKSLSVGAIHESPEDFAQAKSVAVRRKFRYFPFEKS